MSSIESSTTQTERSLDRQIVLEEDEYTEALSQIIARDFFPSLVHLDASNSYLDALGSGDPTVINATVRRLEELNTPYVSSSRRTRAASETPYAPAHSVTPLRKPRLAGDSNGPLAKRPRLDQNLRLDQFQAQYTSEDNSSFTKILQDENIKRKEQYGWAWQTQKRVEEQYAKMLKGRERVLIEPLYATGVKEKLMIEQPAVAKMITNDAKKDEGEKESSGAPEEAAGDEDRKQAALIRPLRTEAEVLAPKKDARSASVDGWKFKARNSLMFSPDADLSPYDPPIPATSSKKPEVLKAIQYVNTRLPGQDEKSASNSASVPSSPARSRIEAAIIGMPYHLERPDTGSGQFVPNVPSPTPSELGPSAVKQLMTWGTLSATPRIVLNDDNDELPTSSTPFHISEVSSRETLSRKLANKASKNLRAKANMLGLNSIGRTPGIISTSVGQENSSMAPPSWTPRRIDAPGNLTPAARRLLERGTLGAAGARRTEIMERNSVWGGNSGLKEQDLKQVRWTPTPGNTVPRRR